MRGLSTDRNGLRRFQFIDFSGKRQSIRLGRMPADPAETIARHIQRILAARKAGASMPSDAAVWLREIPDELMTKLAETGVIERPLARPQARTLGEFLACFLTKCDHLKPSTVTQLKLTKNYLLAFFPSDTPLDSITAGHAIDFRRWMKAQGGKAKKSLADNTVRRQCGRAKQVFADAVKRRIITENPFDRMHDVVVKPNEQREQIVPSETVWTVIKACDDPELRLVLGLARFGGLRIPSELTELRWDHVDREKGVILIHSPKTEHLNGRQTRLIPLWPELIPLLNDLDASQGDRSGYVLTRQRRASNANLSTALRRVCKRAEVPVWPKFFQNLRMTRQTELASAHEEWKVNLWMGNTQSVARRHYLRLTPGDLLDASTWSAAATTPWLKNGSAPASTDQHGSAQPKAKTSGNPSVSGNARDLRDRPDASNNLKVPRPGLEPGTL